MIDTLPKEFEQHGYVYIFVNSTNPNEIKIGKSKYPLARLEQLHNTSTAKPMYAYYVWEVTDMTTAEKIAHASWEDRRIANNREFFNLITSEEAIFTSLEVPLQHGMGHDLAEQYLLTFREVIEEAWDYWKVKYDLINLDYLQMLYEHKKFVINKYYSL